MNIINKTKSKIKLGQTDGTFLYLEADENPIKINISIEKSQIDNTIITNNVITLDNVPEMKEGTIYIVNKDAKIYLNDRSDIYFVTNPQLNEEGNYWYDSLTNIIY